MKPRNFVDRICDGLRRTHSRVRRKFVPNFWTGTGDPHTLILARLQSNIEATAERIKLRMIEPHGRALQTPHARDVTVALLEANPHFMGTLMLGPIDQAELHRAIDRLYSAHPALFTAYHDQMRTDLARLQVECKRVEPGHATHAASNMPPDRLRRQLYCRREALRPEENDAS